MKLLKKVQYDIDFEYRLFSIPILSKYTRSQNGIKSKEYRGLPIKSLNEKLYLEFVDKYKTTCDYILVPSPGLGDIFFFASYLKEFREKYNCKIGVLLREERCREMLSTFECIDEIYVDKYLFWHSFNSDLSSPKIKKNSVIKISFPYDKNLKKLKTFAEHYAYLLGLGTRASMSLPQIPDEYIQEAQQYYKEEGLDASKTIILAPYALYFDYKKIDKTFWDELANRLLTQGYTVVFNTTDYQYSDYKRIFPDRIMLLVAMAAISKAFISIRAGINDVLSGFGLSNQIILYPENFAITPEAIFNKFRDLQLKITDKLNSEEREKVLFNFYSVNANFSSLNLHCKELVIDKKTSEIIAQITGGI